jgi:diguanylate cyclase (GGDEF)-like protein
MILVFFISLFVVIIADVYELNFLKDKVEDLQSIYATMAVRKVIIISFILIVAFIAHFINKEVNYDYMTGLYSRRKLFFDLNKMMGNKVMFTLCFLDLNEFKAINDEYGHPVGDMYLVEFGKVVRTLNPKMIRWYRYAGDEFVAIIKNNLEIEKCIQSIRSINKQEIEIAGGNFLTISFAIGSAQNDFISSADELIKKADDAMYVEKNIQKNAKI